MSNGANKQVRDELLTNNFFLFDDNHNVQKATVTQKEGLERKARRNQRELEAARIYNILF
ncbi:21202_t:CDS:2 [Rhizophagus irregularis]|nr:21202_t:CDS:2 [Rhizophagus irregularis]